MSAPSNRFQLDRPFFRAGLLFAAAFLAIALAAVAARFLLETGLTWRCPFIVLFSVPCPSCGVTRALAALAQLHFMEAVRLNPLITVALGLALFAPVFRLSFDVFLQRRAPLLLATAFGLNWLYLVLFLPR